MSSVREFADKAYQTLARALTDLSTLTIETYTVDPSGKEIRRAMTEIAVDGDMKLYLPVDAEDHIDETLLKQHQKAVDQARGERKALWDQVIKVVQGAIEVEKAEVVDQ